jgi:DNA-directed RNA polymerase specialized sigma24 family protein
MICKAIEDPLEMVPDEVLVEYAREGRCDALEILLTRHGDTVYTIVHNLCGPSSRTEELAYQTVISACRESRSPELKANFRTWLLGRAIQASLAARRNRPAPVFDRRDLADRLREALDRLDDRVQAAFVLCDLAELRAQEAALILQTSAQEIRRLVRRARLMLIGVLDGSFQDLSDSQSLNV